MNRVHKGVSRPVTELNGEMIAPGDKSISHRALMLGSLAVGETRVEGLLEGEDVLRTAAAMSAMGAEAKRIGPGAWRLAGVGVGGLAEPEDVLDMGNAGTGARLLMGILAGQDITAFLTGDESLRSRPMSRVTKPLEMMGARFVTRELGQLPLAVIGATEPVPIEYRLPMPSAQVKSAILIAGLSAPGDTAVIETAPTRDHTERMLRHFGAKVRVNYGKNGTRKVLLTGQPELTAADIVVPRDFSSAAFPLVAALIADEAEVSIPGVNLNPYRCGLLVTLAEMGAQIETLNQREVGGEPVADLRVVSGSLSGVTVPTKRAPSMIDEYPILAVAAAFAEGETRMCGLGELRVKESDRLAAIRDGLMVNGIEARVEGDDLIVHGCPSEVPGGGLVESRHDHRIAMSFLVMGTASKNPIFVDDLSSIATSFPRFLNLMNDLGADLEEL
ncbi:MAG: 3-phosphoshikimate 1-carboxyvinyltransferase [Pseudomonadota bacterium]|nr:3-phosphoshikimate 1-carboxyvinyltransferase [Pseudomonadota bacterium]